MHTIYDKRSFLLICSFSDLHGFDLMLKVEAVNSCVILILLNRQENVIRALICGKFSHN